MQSTVSSTGALSWMLLVLVAEQEYQFQVVQGDGDLTCLICSQHKWVMDDYSPHCSMDVHRTKGRPARSWYIIVNQNNIHELDLTHTFTFPYYNLDTLMS